MILDLIFFFLGLAVLLIAAHIFVSLAVRLAQTLLISPLIIGITIIGFGTSLPELAVAINAALEHQIGLVAGNLVGTNIANIGLTLAIPMMLRSIRIGSTKTQKNAPILLLVTFLFMVLVSLGLFNRVMGMAFLLGGLGLLWWEISAGQRGRAHEDAAMFGQLVETQDIGKKWLVIGLIGSLLVVFLGARLLVDAAVALALALGVSPTLIGLTVVAIGTSLPELSLDLAAVRRGGFKLLVGETIGSNLYNLLFIGGITALISPLYLTNLSGLIGMAVMTTALYLIIRFHPAKYVARWWGGVLLMLYLVYLVLVVLSGHQ
jgi:cation:H+ antiporter